MYNQNQQSEKFWVVNQFRQKQGQYGPYIEMTIDLDAIPEHGIRRYTQGQKAGQRYVKINLTPRKNGPSQWNDTHNGRVVIPQNNGGGQGGHQQSQQQWNQGAPQQNFQQAPQQQQQYHQPPQQFAPQQQTVPPQAPPLPPAGQDNGFDLPF